MAIEILMPALTPTMESGTLAQWLVKPGDSVRAGQIIAELETDKSILELEAFQDGVIAELLVNDGAEEVAVDSVIAIMYLPGEEHETLSDAKSLGTDCAAVTKSLTSEFDFEELHPDKERPEKSFSTMVRASPAAKKRAREAGLDLASVKGTGPGGRIVANDVRLLVEAGVMSANSLPVSSDNAGVELKRSTLQKTMASRMAESKANIPHLYVSIDVDVDRLLKIRRDINDSPEGRHTTLNDYVVKAVALALKDNLPMNVQFSEGRLLQFEQADVAVAVGVEEGLVTPIVRSAQSKSILQLSQEMKNLSEKAHQRKLMPEDYDGGTFTVSNVGMFGLKQSWPIINPPQAGILGVGAAEKRSVIKNDELEIATMMTLTLSADHRVIDGTIAGAFMASVRTYLEKPAQLIL